MKKNSQIIREIKRYKVGVRLTKVFPPEPKWFGIRVWKTAVCGTATFIDDLIEIIIPDKREGTLMTLALSTTFMTVLLFLPYGMYIAKYVFPIALITWGVVFTIIPPFKRKFKIDLGGKTEAFLHKKRKVLCLRSKKDCWIALKGIDDNEGFIEDFLKKYGPVDTIDE